MTGVPGVDLPEEQTEAEVTLTGRGISVSSRVELVHGGVVVVRPSVGAYGDQAAAAGDRAEIVWKGPETQRSLPAAVVEVEHGAVLRWRLRPSGPAEDSQRREAVRARIELPLVGWYSGVDLPGTTVDLSETGLRARFDGYGLPPDAGATLRLRVELEDEDVTIRGEVLRLRTRGPQWLMSIRFLDIAEKDQDRLRRRVFQALREERARRPD